MQQSFVFNTFYSFQKVNDLWDLVNSSTLHAPPSKAALHIDGLSSNIEYIQSFISFIESWKFTNRSSTARNHHMQLPFYTGWLIALNSIIGPQAIGAVVIARGSRLAA
jgi:hypothetical protein